MKAAENTHHVIGSGSLGGWLRLGCGHQSCVERRQEAATVPDSAVELIIQAVETATN
jgi:hypothetical protein